MTNVKMHTPVQPVQVMELSDIEDCSSKSATPASQLSSPPSNNRYHEKKQETSWCTSILSKRTPQTSFHIADLHSCALVTLRRHEHLRLHKLLRRTSKPFHRIIQRTIINSLMDRLHADISVLLCRRLLWPTHRRWLLQSHLSSRLARECRWHFRCIIRFQTLDHVSHSRFGCGTR
jgi:hypothetical protein